ncbi:MAG: methyltransferase domain-containing protein [Terracoccus sp.]
MDAAARRDRVAALFDQLAAGYDQGGVPWFTPIGSRLVELTRPRPGDRAVDIGSGRGAASFALLAAVGPHGHVSAVDLSPFMVDRLRSEADERGITNLDAQVGEASPGRLQQASFDVGTASLVLFFDPEPERTFAGWLSLLRPGGRIGLSTFGATDAAWTAAEAVLLRYAPPALLDARTSGRVGPFTSTATMSTLFHSAGALDVDSHDEPLEVVLPDAQAWRAWTMTLGLRQLWEAVPPAELDRALAEITAALEADRGSDGLLHLTQQVRYTIGSAP